MNVLRALSLVIAIAMLRFVAPAAQNAGGDIRIQPVRGNVYMLVGDGANVTLQVEPPKTEETHDSRYGGDRGVLIVDTGTAGMSDQLLATVRQFSNGPIRYIVNTSADADHTGGNERLVKAAGTVVRGAQGGGSSSGSSTPMMVLAHENVLARMSAPTGRQSPTPLDAWPTDTFLTDKEIFFNGESIQILHQAAAHTDGDSVVYLRRSDVISAGDMFSTVGFPPIDARKGGHIQGVIEGLIRILDLAIPGEKEEGGTMIVPGHGRLSDEADVEFYREMVTIVRDRVQDMVNRGLSLDQAKAEKPTLEYDRRYSKDSWTGDAFVEAVYRDLKR
jgi:cyclase